MTFEQEPRRPGPRPVVSRRRPGALAPTLIILGLLIVGGLVFTQVWTEGLWYRQLGFLSVYRTELVTRTVLFLLGTGLMAGAVMSSLVIAYRTRPVYAPISTEQAGLDRYRDGIEPLRRLVVIAVPHRAGSVRRLCGLAAVADRSCCGCTGSPSTPGIRSSTSTSASSSSPCRGWSSSPA